MTNLSSSNSAFYKQLIFDGGPSEAKLKFIMAYAAARKVWQSQYLGSQHYFAN